LDRLVHRAVVLTALLGGIVLTALILMTCLSVAGRALNSIGLGPVPGDFELVEVGVAFCIFAFLPICQVQSGHATVDLFTSGLGKRPNRFLVAVWEAIFAVVLVVIFWRLFAGMLSKLENGETTMFLQFPIWWAYAASLVPAGVGCCVGLWSAYDRWRAVLTGIETRPVVTEKLH
jgi:TRAP-type C4-dicarboxylate transport system permease small subunit